MKLENIKSKILPPFDNVGIGHAVRYGEWLFISGANSNRQRRPYCWEK